MVAQHTTSTAQFIAPDNWRAAPEEAPGGAFTAVGVHALDHMIEFAGRVRDVRCVTARNYPGPSDDTTTIMLRFESGATGLIFCSVATATNFAVHRLWHATASPRFRAPTCRIFASRRWRQRRRPAWCRRRRMRFCEFSGFDMLHAEMTAFARAIGNGNPYPVPIGDVLHGMAVFDAVVESAKRGAIVAVKPADTRVLIPLRLRCRLS